MNEYLNILNFYLDGKPIYIKLVRLLSLLFIICVSSYLYKYFIEDYTFLEINDYKGILFFIFNGNFVVPLAFFAIVFFVTEIPGGLLFGLFTDIKIARIRNRIMSYEVDGASFYESLQFVQFLVKYLTEHHLSPEIILQAYRENEQELKTKVALDVEANVADNIVRLKEYFLFCNRALIALCFIKAHVATFHLPLFICLLGIIAFSLLGIYFAYHVASLFPTLIQKFCDTADRYSYHPQRHRIKTSSLISSSATDSDVTIQRK